MMNENAKRWAPSTPPTLQERSVGWVESSEPHRHQVKEFDPEGIVLSAQAAGLGKLAKTKFEPEGLVLRDRSNVERPLTGPRQSGHPLLPRPAAWADRTGLSGRRNHVSLT